MNAHVERPTGGDLVPRTEITSIVQARDAALAKMTEAADTLVEAYALSQEASEIEKRATAGHLFYASDRRESDHYKSLFNGRFDRAKALDVYRKQIDASVWTHLMERTGMKTMMDTQAKKEFETNLVEDVPEVTVENIAATFEHLMGNSDEIFKRGMANAFTQLDRRFKSHDAFKVGSRIILENVFDHWGSWSYSGRRRDMITDIERVFAVLDSKKPNPGALFKAIEDSRGRGINPRQSECETEYFRIRGFKNGNAHFWMLRDDLVEKVNKLLGEYYGDVLPDGVDEGNQKDVYKIKGTALAKDLQFYPTPKDGVDFVMNRLSLYKDSRVLEPSAGDGALIRGLMGLSSVGKIDAIEVDARHMPILQSLASDRVRVYQANFLRVKPTPIYDAVVMNPPFYGTHWMKHVRHAFDFLKPQGKLYAILPITAEVGESAEHQRFHAFVAKHKCDRWSGPWMDMPERSFAASGTNINTVILELRK